MKCLHFSRQLNSILNFRCCSAPNKRTKKKHENCVKYLRWAITQLLLWRALLWSSMLHNMNKCRTWFDWIQHPQSTMKLSILNWRLNWTSANDCEVGTSFSFRNRNRAKSATGASAWRTVAILNFRCSGILSRLLQHVDLLPLSSAECETGFSYTWTSMTTLCFIIGQYLRFHVQCPVTSLWKWIVPIHMISNR